MISEKIFLLARFHTLHWILKAVPRAAVVMNASEENNSNVGQVYLVKATTQMEKIIGIILKNSSNAKYDESSVRQKGDRWNDRFPRCLHSLWL